MDSVVELNKEEVLRNRALVLAQRPAHAASRADIEVFEFKLGNEHHAIKTRYIREVYPLSELALLPGTPPFVLGITNVRGQIISIIDIRELFELPKRQLSDLSRIVILHDGKMEFGVLADEIIGVRMISKANIKPLPATLTGIRRKYLHGVTANSVAVWDILRLINDDAIVVDDIVA